MFDVNHEDVLHSQEQLSNCCFLVFVKEMIKCAWRVCVCVWGLLYVTFTEVVCGLHDSKLIKEVVGRPREKVSPSRIHCPLPDSWDKRVSAQRERGESANTCFCLQTLADWRTQILDTLHNKITNSQKSKLIAVQEKKVQHYRNLIRDCFSSVRYFNFLFVLGVSHLSDSVVICCAFVIPFSSF